MLSREQTVKYLEKAKSGEEKAKEVLILENTPLVKSIVKRYLGKGVEFEDLFQIGIVGLIKAMNNFDPSFCVQFSTYAVPMIAGEIKRFLRDDGSIKVSRSIKQNCILIGKFIEKFQEENKKSPTIKEIAEKFKMEESEVVFTLESNKRPVFLYQKVENDESGQMVLDKISQEDETEKQLERIEMQNALKSLSERDKKIVLLRFYRDKTQSEVAKILGVSQVQVSRLENKILSYLKDKMQEKNDQ